MRLKDTNAEDQYMTGDVLCDDDGQIRHIQVLRGLSTWVWFSALERMYVDVLLKLARLGS